MSKSKKLHKKPSAAPRPSANYMTPGMAYALTMANRDYNLRQDMRKTMMANEEARRLCRQHLVDTESWFYACICLALRREFGYGAKRILRVLELAQDIHNDQVETGMTDRELWKIVYDETGIIMDDHDKEAEHA